jgi:hypothetical protein
MRQPLDLGHSHKLFMKKEEMLCASLINWHHELKGESNGGYREM